MRMVVYVLLAVGFFLGDGGMVMAADTCGTCAIPCARGTDELFTVRCAGGRKDPPQGFSHIIRDTVMIGGSAVQAYRLSSFVNGSCRDTLLVAEYAETLVMGNTLGKTPPLYIPVRPVAEYVLTGEPTRRASYAEGGIMFMYGGKDESAEPKIGFNGIAYGLEVLVAPFGTMLGNNLSLALGGGLMLEGGRSRFPILGHLRYTFTSTTVRSSARYIPNACAFSCTPTSDTIAAPQGAVRRPGPDSVDRAAILVHERVVEEPVHAPYVFVEGGPILNGSFDGAGPDPSVNPNEYGQYALGAGAGIPIFSWLHAQLAYRYARLNLRTPCVECQNVYQVNTNSVHAVMLRVLLHWGW